MTRAANPATHLLVEEDLPMAKHGAQPSPGPATACGLRLDECAGYYLTPFVDEVWCIACLRAAKAKAS